MRGARSERGASAVTVATSMFVLLGFVSLAIDSGLSYNTLRGSQNAADNAALAAAWEACNPRVTASPDPVDAARTLAADNGFDHNDPAIDVAVSNVGTGSYEVVITTTDPARFGIATPVAPDQITVVARAVAECDLIPFLGGYAIFAGADQTCSGGAEVSLSGASQIVTGGLHSNGDIHISGATTIVNGPITYRGTASPTTPGTAQQVIGPPIPYPISIQMASFEPGGSAATVAAAAGEYFNAGTNDIDENFIENMAGGEKDGSKIKIKNSGIYFTYGNIHLSNVDTEDDVTVTFVSSNGTIHVTGSADIDAYWPVTGGASDPGLLMFSTYQEPPAGPTCTGDAIQYSVNNATWSGVIFAPYGQVTQSASSSATLDGSVFAYTVDLSGSSIDIVWQNNPAAAPDIAITLNE